MNLLVLPIILFENVRWFLQNFCITWISLGGGFKYFLFFPLLGEMIQFDLRIFFKMGGKIKKTTHQLAVFSIMNKRPIWGETSTDADHMDAWWCAIPSLHWCQVLELCKKGFANKLDGRNWGEKKTIGRGELNMKCTQACEIKWGMVTHYSK